jgi:antirestriction protein ArdC
MSNIVTKLIEQMEEGADTWTMPWRKITGFGYPSNFVTGIDYRGGNVLTLAFTAADKGYPTGKWATYKQWESVGGQVRKGEKGTHCLFWNRTTTTTDTEDAKTVSRGFYNSFVVFNHAQIDNAPALDIPVLPELDRIEGVERFFGALDAEIVWGGNRACYNPTTDRIHVPNFDQFDSTEHAYATLAHEVTHWTGHKARLARVFGKRFGDHEYAAEELVAELGSAFLCARLGIDTAERTDHAAYLKHWISMLRANPSLLWSVASKAQAATDYIVERVESVAVAA